MDTESFDRLVRLFGTSGTRRAALSTLIGTALAGILPGSMAARKRGKGKSQAKGTSHKKSAGRGKKHKKHARVQAVPPGCYTGTRCDIGRLKNASNCNFEGSLTFTPNKDLWRINLSGANLRGVNATGANLTDANLSNACLVDAILKDANLTRTNLGNAIRCRTKRPDGTFDNSGCNSGTECCPTCNVAPGGSCAAAGDVCCGPASCQGGVCVCPAGLTACNGACVDLLRDPNNCTACGNVCPRPLARAFVQCGQGINEAGEVEHGCTMLCERGSGNCSGNPLTGCETRLHDDPNNCGSCGFECPADRPICCGCLCFADNTQCSTCPPFSSARVIRR